MFVRYYTIFKFIIPVLFLLTFFSSVTKVFAAAVTVSPGQSIQNAVNSAANGDIITVLPGTYNETVKVTKSVTIAGGGDNTIVQEFIISAPSVTLKNFSVTGSSDTGVVSSAPGSDIENIHSYNNPDGGVILQIGSDGSKLIGNRLEHDGHFGIKVNSNNNLIQNNEVWNTYYSTDEDGMYGFGANNTWDGNYVHDMSYTDADKPHIRTQAESGQKLLP